MRDGFNPYRVFSGAATLFQVSPSGSPSWFQSLSGFLGRCNGRLCTDHRFSELVSIPIGFSRALQLIHRSRQNVVKLFQSLSGFLGRCNEIASRSIARDITVSIPIGFSRALQLGGVFRPLVAKRVSIPIGFSRALQLKLSNGLRTSTSGFQSLSGFLGRCNILLAILYDLCSNVSIPIGFSRALQRREIIDDSPLAEMFQSLSGFLGRCNFSFAKSSSFFVPSFNPYRVFSGAATSFLACSSL